MNEKPKVGVTKGANIREAMDQLHGAFMQLRALRVQINGREDETTGVAKGGAEQSLSALLSELPDEISNIAKNISSEVEELRGALF